MANDIEEVSLRPNVRPILVAVVANVVLAGALLGWPYLRGGWRAEASMAAFARFGACLFEADVASTPGLGLPLGERSRYATLALRGQASWPGRCRDALRSVVEDEARFLFPSVKAAENDVRDRVRRLDRELARVERERATGVVAERPLELLTQLQAALAEQARAAGLTFDPTRAAIRLGDAVDLPAPSIIPLQIASGGAWSIGLDGEAFVATATDYRRVGHVRVAAGRIEQRAAQRPRLASGSFGGREPPWVAWITAPDECREDRCAHRATGLAALTRDRQRLRPSAWLAAHPVGEGAAGVLLASDSVWIAAVGEPEQVALRRFARPAPSVEEEPALLRPELERAVTTGAVAQVQWLPGEPPALAWHGPDGAGVATGRAEDAPIEPRLRGTVRIASCGTAQHGWVALGSERGTRLQAVGGAGAHALPLRVSPPDRGTLRLVCDGDQVEVWARQDGGLVRARCTVDACAPPEAVVARGVDRYDVVRFDGASWVAHAAGSEGAVRLTALRAGEAPATVTPAACWTPTSGLCGEPRLAADARRMVLVARQGADLRVLETADGVVWRGLVGLEQP